MPNKISQIETLIKNLCQKTDFPAQFEYHIIAVKKYALKLAKKYQAHQEVVELAALFHDIGRITTNSQHNHDLAGVKQASKILKKFGYSQEIIDKVNHCIRTHRSRERKPETLEAKIIATADTMSHFDLLPVLTACSIRIKNIDLCHLTKEDVKIIYKWLNEKIERGWHQKLLLPEAKELIKKKYKAIRVVLDGIKNYH